MKTFFGDGEHDFALPFPLIQELERTTGAGIGVLYQRIRAMTFRVTDITETIRLGLIGGGITPKAAHDLTQTYAAQRPLAETLPVALAILDVVWFGTPADQPDTVAASDITAETITATMEQDTADDF